MYYHENVQVACVCHDTQPCGMTVLAAFINILVVPRQNNG